MRILCDVDGVFADFTGHALSTMGELAPVGGEEEITTWDMFPHLSPEARCLSERAWREQGWCSGIPVYPEALWAYGKLESIGKVIWVTSPMVNAPYWCHERTLWLQRYFRAELEDIILTSGKYHVWGDVLIDDKIENLEKWCKHNPQGFGILWDQPYNRAWVPGAQAIRARTWEEVILLLTGLKSQKTLKGTTFIRV